MNLQTFKAPTMAEALAQVKGSMGGDAVILHTRTYHTRMWLGLRRREVVEITAGRGLNVPNRSRRTTTTPPRASSTSPAFGRVGYAPISRELPIPSRTTLIPADAIDGSRQLMQTPAAGNAVILGLSQEMTALKTMVKDLVTQTRQAQSPSVPEELFDYYLQLVNNQVAAELATEMIKTLQHECRAEHLRDPEFVRSKLADQLEKLLPTAGPIVRRKTTGPHIVALIGPTGVGKTTTIAKLAANLKLREKHRVGLVTIDTYRIGAVDQLKKYADIIGAPLRIVGSPEELAESVTALSDNDFILIDTAGRSPNDVLKLSELKTFLAAANPDEVHLVLSTTASQSCVELAIQRFGDIRADRIIFTKIDEAAHVGVVLNVIRKVNKSLSYITTGQDVPDDIEVGRGRKLAELILSKSSVPPA